MPDMSVADAIFGENDMWVEDVTVIPRSGDSVEGGYVIPDENTGAETIEAIVRHSRETHWNLVSVGLETDSEYTLLTREESAIGQGDKVEYRDRTFRATGERFHDGLAVYTLEEVTE